MGTAEATIIGASQAPAARARAATGGVLEIGEVGHRQLSQEDPRNRASGAVEWK